MIISESFDGWGNRLIQQCFARALASKLDYALTASNVPWVTSLGSFNPTGTKINSPEVFISHKSDMRHKVDMNELIDLAPCKFRIHSYLEYYPNIEEFSDQIKKDWVVIPNKYNRTKLFDLETRFKTIINGKIVSTNVDHITSRDIVLSVRLGRDYLKQHKYRLLLGDYFKIVLDNVDYDRLFITSQDPYNTILNDLWEYNPIFLDHISPIHTLNFVRLFNKIVISQSTYSWWAAYLSDADEIYFPITKDGPWSYGPNQRDKWKRYGHDLMVDEDRYKYVSYNNRLIVGDYQTARGELGI